MNIVVTGSTGLIGTALVASLTAGGHSVTRLVRREPRPGEAHWDPASGKIDAAALEGVGGVVHLAGENIAERWTPKKKARIRDSRLKGTLLLAQTLGSLKNRPAVLVSASAIGYYGNRGDERLTEDSPPGSGFLADLAREWEAATDVASRAGVRVVLLRNGIVLSAKGGALAKMLPPFKMGVGGKLGSGSQYMSWIAIDDTVGVIEHALATATMKGPVNAVAPQPVTNLEFTKTMGKVLGRPTVFPVPAFAMRLAFGEMAEEVLLAGARVEPARLKASGYRFLFPDLEGALRHVLSR